MSEGGLKCSEGSLASDQSALNHSSQSHYGLELTSDLSVSDGTLHHTDGSLRVSSALAVWLTLCPTQSQALVTPAAVVFASIVKWRHIRSRARVVLWRGLGVPCQDRLLPSMIDSASRRIMLDDLSLRVKHFWKNDLCSRDRLRIY